MSFSPDGATFGFAYDSMKPNRRQPAKVQSAAHNTMPGKLRNVSLFRHLIVSVSRRCAGHGRPHSVICWLRRLRAHMPTALKTSLLFPFSLLLMLLVIASPSLQAQQPDAPQENFIKSHYTKYEYRIPMRDGKRLFTAVYVPKQSAFPGDPGPYPIMMDRTPYSVGPYGEDQYPARLGPSDEFEKGGYIFVYQDVRGRWMSEGEFVEMHPHIDDKKGPKDVDDSSDTYDTIEFLLKHVDNNNGKVGIWGISYPGFYTSASIIDSHPAIVAASPQAPMTDLFQGDDSYHGGAFMLSANFGFYVFFYPQDRASDAASDTRLRLRHTGFVSLLSRCRQPRQHGS